MDTNLSEKGQLSLSANFSPRANMKSNARLALSRDY
jgi:hypothetical protein